MWDLFGEDRIFFGSDWPNSDTLANYDETFAVAQRYIATRSSNRPTKVLLEEFDFGVQMAAAHRRPVAAQHA